MTDEQYNTLRAMINKLAAAVEMVRYKQDNPDAQIFTYTPGVSHELNYPGGGGSGVGGFGLRGPNNPVPAPNKTEGSAINLGGGAGGGSSPPTSFDEDLLPRTVSSNDWVGYGQGGGSSGARKPDEPR